uniref:Vegetative cell wall protein gp1-like n=1 Tax=Steinernema glaseri TaxID=37863 RepID=A0A1I7ZR02_9BILA
MASSEKPQPPSPCNPCLTPEDTSHKSPGEIVAPYCRPILACRVLEDTSHKPLDKKPAVQRGSRLLASCKPCRPPEDTSLKPSPEITVPHVRPILSCTRPSRPSKDTSLRILLTSPRMGNTPFNMVPGF